MSGDTNALGVMSFSSHGDTVWERAVACPKATRDLDINSISILSKLHSSASLGFGAFISAVVMFRFV